MLRPVLLLLLAAACCADEASLASRLDPAAPFRLALDLDALRSATGVRPLGAWWQPEGAAARAHIAAQGRLLARRQPGLAPALSALPDLRRLAVSGRTPGDQGMPLALHCQGSDPAVFFAIQDKAPAWTREADGWRSAGSPGCDAPHPAHPPLRQPIVLQADGSRLAELDRRLALAGRPRLPWDLAGARVLVEIGPEADGWQGRCELGHDLGLHPIARSLAGLPRSDRSLRLALGFDPRWGLRQLFSLLPGEGRSFATEVLGLDPDRLAESFTGDLLLLASPGQIWPDGALVLGLRPEAAVRTLAGNLALLGGGQGATVPGADAAWKLPSQAGEILLAIGSDRLVLGNDHQLVAELLAGRPGDLPLPPGTVAQGAADPLFLTTWLPILAQRARLPLGTDPWPWLAQSLRQCALAAVQAGRPPSALLLGEEPWRWEEDGMARSLLPARGLLLSLLAEATPGGAAELDQALAVYSGEGRQVVLARLDRGWIDLAQPLHRLRPESARQLVAGLQRTLGPDLPQQGLLLRPERPRLDLLWMPSPSVMARHLPPWRLQVAVEDGRLLGQETGIPATSLALAVAVLDAWLVADRLSPGLAGQGTSEW